MDFDNPWMLVSGLVIGLVGLGFFTYGRKQQNLSALATGAALCVYPYFVSSAAVLWGLFAAVMIGAYALRRMA